jgi:hypothetical protein
MTNQYYASPVDLAPGTKARAGDINTIDQSVDAAFDKLPSELALKSGTVNYAVNKGPANAYAVDLAAAITAYADGLEVKMLPGADNTGACTLNVNALGAIAIKRQDGTAAQAGDLVGASPITLVYVAASNTFRLPPLANAQVTAAAASAVSAANSAAAAAASSGNASGYAGTALQARNDANTAAYNAGQSAGAAAQSASNASTSAGQASGSAQSAATSAANLATAVTNASGSATAANTSAQAAAGSATAANTSAGAAAGSATAANTSAGNAATSASQAATSASNASASATAAASSASSALTSAGQAAANALLAKEGLAAIAQQFHTGYVVDMFLYDTAKDSDGGAWRKRCKATTWENEALVPGKWLGQFGSTAAAVAAGGLVGDYFQYTGDNAFYQITQTSPATAVPNIYRGNTREFPALALIVAETGRIIIYDATQPTLPMWMVFTNKAAWNDSLLIGSTISCITALNGKLIVGESSNSQGVMVINFVADNAVSYTSTSTYGGVDNAGLSLRNTTGHTFASGTSAAGVPSIVHNTVNDVAAIVLADAPAEPATGLPMPTIAIATNGGVSVLKHDGTIVNITGQLQANNSVGFTKDRRLATTGQYQDQVRVYDIPAATITLDQQKEQYGAGVASIAITTGGACFTIGDDMYSLGAGLFRLKRNPATPVKGMVAAITNAFNSGYQVGDSRGAWLADIVAETLAEFPELVTNGTFNTDTTGWYGTNSPTLAVSASGVTVTKPTGTDVTLAQTINTTPGKTYQIQWDVTATSGNYIVGAQDNVGNNLNGTGYIGTVANKLTVQFTATTPTSTVYLQKGGASGSGTTFDNVSVKQTLVTNGNFDSNLNGWTVQAAGASTVTWSAGQARIAPDGTNSALIGQQITGLVPGRAYMLGFTVAGDPVLPVIGTTISNGNVWAPTPQAAGSYTYTFIAPQSSVWISFTRTAAGIVPLMDNISLKPVDLDRSVKSKPLMVNGSLTKAPVATGAQLVSYSGFSAANYLEQTNNTDLDFGTGDFCFLAWVIKAASGAMFILERGHTVNVAGDFSLTTDINNNLGCIYQNVAAVNSTLGIPLNIPSLVGYFRRSGKGYFTVNGVVQNVDTGAASSLTSAGAVFRVGANVPGTNAFVGQIALVRASATAPTDDQVAQIYRDELALFQPGAQCAFDGTALGVAVAAYDDVADLLHVGTSWGRSTFKGLQRVESSATSVGAVKALAGTNGAHITGGTTGARYTQPAITLRDELRRKDDARRALGRIPAPHWFTGDGTATTFTVPIGFDVYAVYRQGLLVREGSSNDYTTAFDGYRWTVTFTSAPPANFNICIMGVRNG